MQRQRVAHAADLQHLTALLLVDPLLEEDDGVDGLVAVLAVHIAALDQADGGEHLLHVADGLPRGVCVDNHVALAVARILLGSHGGLSGGSSSRRCGGFSGGSSGCALNPDALLHAVAQVLLGQQVALAGDGQGLRAEVVVDELLEVLDRSCGAAAVLAVHVAALEQANLLQQLLHLGDLCLGGGGVDGAAVVGRVHGLGGGRSGGGGLGGRGVQGLGGGRRRLLLEPPVDVVVQVGLGQLVHHAVHVQGAVALQLVHADLEVLHRGGGAGAEDAVGAALGQQAQRDQLLLQAANQGLGGACVDNALVGGCGHQRLRRGRGLGQRDRGIVQPLQGLFARNAVHGQLLRRGAVLVDVGLEVLHGLLGGGIVPAGHVGAAQPAQLHQILLQGGDVGGAGGAADGVVLLLGDDGGHLRGGGSLLLLLVVLLLHVAVVGVVHPRKLGIHQRREGGGGVGRGGGRGHRHPGGVGGHGGERIVQRHVVRVAHGVEEQHQTQGDHQHHGGRDADVERDPLAMIGLVVCVVHVAAVRCGCTRAVLALGDVSRAVFFKIEVALLRILHALHAGAQLFHAGVEGVLHAGHGNHRAVVQALGAVAGQVFADADGSAALGVQRGVHDAARILAQRAAHQKAVAVHQAARQHLDLRNRGARVLAAVRADALAVQILKAVHAQIFVCHIFNSFGGKSGVDQPIRPSTSAHTSAKISSIVRLESMRCTRSGSAA